MENFICVQCGTQFGETAEPPSRCPICEDERQFVRRTGQEWTTLERLRADHHNRRLLGIGTEPEFAIGQRALLLQSPSGNLLWDCISLLSDETIAEVNARGGIRAIAISHPHFYSSMIEWADRFDAQIFLHAADREWVVRPAGAGSRIQFWEGSTLSLWDGLTLINLGGHFEGGTVLHWPAASRDGGSKGALLTGDIITVVQAPCSQATSLPSCRTGVTSASCEVIQILFRLERRRSAASSRELNRSHSSRCMAAGGRPTFSPMLKRQSCDPPNAICGGSVVRLPFLSS